jgi:hypothetical protein
MRTAALSRLTYDEPGSSPLQPVRRAAARRAHQQCEVSGARATRGTRGLYSCLEDRWGQTVPIPTYGLTVISLEGAVLSQESQLLFKFLDVQTSVECHIAIEYSTRRSGSVPLRLRGRFSGAAAPVCGWRGLAIRWADIFGRLIVSVWPTHLERPVAGSQDGVHQTS